MSLEFEMLRSFNNNYCTVQCTVIRAFTVIYMYSDIHCWNNQGQWAMMDLQASVVYM